MDLKLGGRFGFWLLRSLSHRPDGPEKKTGDAEPTGGAAKLQRFFGTQVWQSLSGRTVMDYGCGEGAEVVAAAMAGARRVYGVDVRDKMLASAAQLARAHGVADRCMFVNALSEPGALGALRGTVDVIYSLDCFEHYPSPEAVMDSAYDLLAPGGMLLISFGPPWYHAFGAHMGFFCGLPWMQIFFDEATILSVRSLYRSDGATRFQEVDGGLNQMTLDRFTRLIDPVRFETQSFQAVPVRGWTWLVKHAVIREYFTSVVRCVLIKRPESRGVEA